MQNSSKITKTLSAFISQPCIYSWSETKFQDLMLWSREYPVFVTKDRIFVTAWVATKQYNQHQKALKRKQLLSHGPINKRTWTSIYFFDIYFFHLFINFKVPYDQSCNEIFHEYYSFPFLFTSLDEQRIYFEGITL